jgi:phosphoribosylaminoimidazolecarboxamide formyltransferase/IMP cyclohydrolase
MQNLQKISRCLISVSDKNGIVELSKYLTSKGVEIISTGGTFQLLKQNKIAVTEICEFTKFPEIMDGRIKTLHPKVHGALLAINDNPQHFKQVQENKIAVIDLLIVNFYPFSKAVANSCDEKIIIENIDIGGPAMVRAAGKNFAYKTVIIAASLYQDLITEMEKNSGATSAEFRRDMAARAFKEIADYDIMISDWFNRPDPETSFGEQNLRGVKLQKKLRYGENAHQKAALYSNSALKTGIVGAKQLQGKELSYNNLNDADAAYNLVLEFEQPACCIIKHSNPCAAANAPNLLMAYKKALACDPKSAFGGVVALNGKIDEALAKEMGQMFYEVIIARSVDKKAAAILAAKKNLRLLIPDFKKTFEKQIKSISGGFLIQDSDQKIISRDQLKLVSKKSVNAAATAQLIFALTVCKHAKSNAVVVAQDFQTIGIGSGQTSRVDACHIACKKAAEFLDGKKNIDHAGGSFLASDAFLPFADNIEIAAAYKISAIVAPKGSIRDEEVIAKADEKNIALYFVETRHFKH